ncbi:MAG: acyltransferase [Selenomonadaceae bacterium]|nr:acyltransferase [Selenomonadaceae bacterium]
MSNTNNKERLPELELIRGISMLGVIGIHIGSQYLMNPTPNIHLVALFEILTRFSVPIFFFVSAFGLFWRRDLDEPVNYRSFYLRRAKSVLVPYLFWSFFYIFHYTVLYRSTMLLHVREIVKYLIFGFGSYQLYFMVILMWFYLLMPLWIPIVKRLTVRRLAVLLIVQIAFDYWSCFILKPASFANPYISYLIAQRLNYWVLHYFFIFLTGAYCAVHWQEFKAFIESRLRPLTVFFLVGGCGLLAHYYYLIKFSGYRPEWAINVAQQLSPIGILYTLASSLFFFSWFRDKNLPAPLSRILGICGYHSYFAYLFHPIMITYVGFVIAGLGHVYTAPVIICYYLAVAAGSVLVGSCLRKIGRRYPLINELTIGTAK